MLGRQYSLKNQADFTAVRRQGRRTYTEHLGCFLLPTQNQLSRFGVVVGSKVAGSSVVRNEIRRTILTAIQELKPTWQDLKAHDVVIQVLKTPQEGGVAVLAGEINQCLNKA